ncbi:hypothetical protein IAD21_01687 [Abditibacteriota bacterium]|nr:hypothetical protein IAD21_01687 [Abditibacteriota bacterium]
MTATTQTRTKQKHAPIWARVFAVDDFFCNPSAIKSIFYQRAQRPCGVNAGSQSALAGQRGLLIFDSARLPLMEPAQAGVWPQAPKPPL